MGKESTGEKCKTRLFVVDEYPLIREGLKRVIGQEADLEICGEAHTVQRALEGVAINKPDLILLDLRIGNGDGLELIKSLKVKFPLMRILAVSQFDEAVYAERTLRAGAHGFVMKRQEVSELLKAIRAVLDGQLYAGSRLATLALNKMLCNSTNKEKPRKNGVEGLTDRELQIFHLLGAVLSVGKIASELGLSVKTVETHRENIKHKLGFNSAKKLAEHATKWVERNGQVTISRELAD